jgi:hypothetical protein
MTRSQLRKRFADLTRREARKLFLSYEGKARTFDYQAGDVGYVSFLRQLFR